MLRENERRKTGCACVKRVRGVCDDNDDDNDDGAYDDNDGAYDDDDGALTEKRGVVVQLQP